MPRAAVPLPTCLPNEQARADLNLNRVDDLRPREERKKRKCAGLSLLVRLSLASMSCTHLRAQLYVRTMYVPSCTSVHSPSASASASASAPASPSASASARPPSHHLSALHSKKKKTLPSSHLIHFIHPVTHTWYYPIPCPAVLDQARSISPLDSSPTHSRFAAV
jgi:hypothetical protein